MSRKAERVIGLGVFVISLMSTYAVAQPSGWKYFQPHPESLFQEPFYVDVRSVEKLDSSVYKVRIFKVHEARHQGVDLLDFNGKSHYISEIKPKSRSVTYFLDCKELRIHRSELRYYAQDSPQQDDLLLRIGPKERVTWISLLMKNKWSGLFDKGLFDYICSGVR